jgi:hypothetical protein
MKHPPRQYTDDEAYRLTEAFIIGGEEESPREAPEYPSSKAAEAQA